MFANDSSNGLFSERSDLRLDTTAAISMLLIRQHSTDYVQLMETKYTKMETDSHLVVQSVKSDLTPALSMLTDILLLASAADPRRPHEPICARRD